MTWPTKDEDSSSEYSPPTQSLQLSAPNVDEEDDEQLLKRERFDDEPKMCIPLRMILIPTEEELNSSQITPSSSFKSFSLLANYPDVKDLETPTPFKSDFNGDGSGAAGKSQQQLPLGFDAEKQSNDPKWAADPDDLNYSFDIPESPPSPPNSPGFQRKRLQP